MATLSVPHPLPSPAEDAEQIMKACKGWGTDEKALIMILAHRDAEQRKQIMIAYEERYNENLIKRLESELSGHFERAVYRWIFDPVEREAITANVAVKQRIDFRAIIELACITSSDELLSVKKAYQARYKHSLEEDVASHSNGDLRKFMVGLVGPYRYDGDEIDVMLASCEARILHEAVIDKMFHHEEIIRVLTTRSKAQLNATFNIFKDQFGISVTKSLISNPPTELVYALRIAIRCFTSPHKYLEKVLRNCANKTGTDEDVLTRIIVTHAEKDLKLIKEMYFKRNNITLEQAVGNATSGDYKTFLLALIGN